jgi:double-stranded uracil-DNA glycosylase
VVQPWKPTKEQLQAAYGKRVPDVIGPNLRVLFVGINPGLYSAAVARHFARPGNRFWPALHAGGFTERVLSPFESETLLAGGYGIVNIVDRGTAMADELTRDELREGARRLARKLRKYRPRFAAVLGITAYRTGFDEPAAKVGRQDLKIGDTLLWVLPNPSGLNAHFQARHLAELFKELYVASHAE